MYSPSDGCQWPGINCNFNSSYKRTWLYLKTKLQGDNILHVLLNNCIQGEMETIQLIKV